MSELWQLVHAEREALAEDLAGLDETQWATPSLCEGWSVRDCLAHLTATAKISPGAFFKKFVGSGFNLSRMQAKDVAVERGSSGADALSRFRAQINSTTSPPGPKTTWLGEVLVHAEDIRRPLGIARAYPAEAATRVAEFYAGSNAIIGAKKRVAGLTLVATDVEWTIGSGPEVRGPIAAIITAMTGRQAALADLSGHGVTTLAGRN